MRGDGGVAGEGRVASVPKFDSWVKCTMSLTNISSDWMSNASCGLSIILYITRVLYFTSWGVNFSDYPSFLPQVLLPNPVVVPVRVPPLLNPVKVVPVQEQDLPPTPALEPGEGSSSPAGRASIPAPLLLPIVGMHTVSYIPISSDYIVGASPTLV